ncbi:MAG: FAD:protein FMN transferase [Verrucomicrobia bacterium]|nr:FAD:protein FMN transferase [Verrucomicrobiota bacterium]
MNSSRAVRDSNHPLSARVNLLAYISQRIGLIALGANHAVAQQAEEVTPLPQRQYFSQPHLGTIVQIAFYSNDKEFSQKIAQDCFGQVKKLDRIFSDYRSDSEVSRLCGKPVKMAHKISKDLFDVIAQAQEISNTTNGAFDITLGHTTQNWRQSARQKKLLLNDDPETSYKDLILYPKSRSILLRKPLKIDLGGIAKGYIADQLMMNLSKVGIKQAAVIIGGEMIFTEAPPKKNGWTVGIERPSREMLGTLTISNTALSTSGDSYQFFEQGNVRHAHLIDPSSGKPKTNRLNVTTIARSAMLADAWATALRISTQENALKLANETKGIEATFITFGKPARFTTGFPKLKKLHQSPSKQSPRK